MTHQDDLNGGQTASNSYLDQKIDAELDRLFRRQAAVSALAATAALDIHPLDAARLAWAHADALLFSEGESQEELWPYSFDKDEPEAAEQPEAETEPTTDPVQTPAPHWPFPKDKAEAQLQELIGPSTEVFEPAKVVRDPTTGHLVRRISLQTVWPAVTGVQRAPEGVIVEKPAPAPAPEPAKPAPVDFVRVARDLDAIAKGQFFSERALRNALTFVGITPEATTAVQAYIDGTQEAADRWLLQDLANAMRHPAFAQGASA